MVPESALDRYQLVVDGEFYSGRRIREVTRGSQDFNLRQVPMVELAKHMYWRLRRRLLGGN
jgi:hypothetical protein